MNKGLIFDLDGTLWNSVEQVKIAWNEVLRRYPETDGLQLTTQMLESIMGKTIPEIAQIFLPKISPERGAEILNEGCIEEMNRLSIYGGILYPNLKETLQELGKNYKLMVVSNSQDGYVQTFIKAHGLENVFADYEMAGRTGLCKGENIKLVVERNGLDEATYVGDTEMDYEAAMFAGVNFLHAAYGFGSVKEPCEKLNTFADLLAKFAQALSNA